jgi:hypothetical protein
MASEEKLRLLLVEGHESEQLDYKAACDLSQVRDKVELAKDLGAMQALGGYMVIGADDHGKTTNRLTASWVGASPHLCVSFSSPNLAGQFELGVTIV